MSAPQTVLVLGGGLFPDGTLTTLSKQRLDEAIVLYKNHKAPKITVLGGLKSTYFIDAIQYEKTGAERRADYLISQGVASDDILQIPDGKDTLGEALACRKALPGFRVTHFILVTSTIHMPRAEWLFRTVLGDRYQMETHGVSCGGILLEEEEKEYLQTTQQYIHDHPGCLNRADNWHKDNEELYASFKAIHDRHHPKGKESQAYFARKPDDKSL